MNFQNYEDGFLANDLVLLKLASDATLNNFVRLMCVPEVNQEFFDSVVCFAAGWGAVGILR